MWTCRSQTLESDCRLAARNACSNRSSRPSPTGSGLVARCADRLQPLMAASSGPRTIPSEEPRFISFCPPTSTDPVHLRRQRQLAGRLQLQRTAKAGEVVITVPDGVILEHELAGDRRIG